MYEYEYYYYYLLLFVVVVVVVVVIYIYIYIHVCWCTGVAGYEARDSPLYCGYNPQFPVSSPYVLAVGATQGPENANPEVACSSDTGGIITSGGGFSDVYPMPSYQYAAVRDGYLAGLSASDNAPAPGYSRTGRAYPDISALGYNYLLLIGRILLYIYVILLFKSSPFLIY
jgi:tripeptidyl-peptidase-1